MDDDTTNDGSPSVRSDDIRYAPRAVEDAAWMRELLHDQPAGVVGFVDDGAPYIVSQLFVYDDEREAVFFHGAPDGRTRGIVEGAAGSGNGTDDGNEDATGVDACLAVHEMGRFVPAEHPVNFDVEYASVVVFGRVRLVEGEAEKRRTLSLFMDAFAPHLEAGADYGEIRSESVGRTSVYQLDVEGWSGKRHEAESEADGFEPYGLADARESAGGRGSADGRESADARDSTVARDPADASGSNLDGST